MNKSILITAHLVVLTFMNGCAIHPLPEDYSGVDTNNIVRQIRCETRQAMIDMAVEYFTDDPYVDSDSKAIGAKIFIQHALPISSFNPNLFKGHVHETLEVFWTTGIAYNFKLNMIEDNNFNAGLGFDDPFVRGPTTGNLSSVIGGSFNRQRGNTRTFTVTDSVGALLNKINDDFCANRIVGPNYVYPITGKIGIGELLRTFVYLSIFGGLMGSENDSSKPPTMVDSLQFETIITGAVNPTQVIFSPIRNTFALVGANFSAEVKRKDRHEVTVGVALDSAAVNNLGNIRDFLFNNRGNAHGSEAMKSSVSRSAYFGRLLTASGTRSEIAAAEAVDQYLTQKIFSPTITINP